MILLDLILNYPNGSMDIGYNQSKNWGDAIHLVSRNA
ncbi:hypothetical protein M2142_002168 [Fusobacterium sp. PH5-29]